MENLDKKFNETVMLSNSRNPRLFIVNYFGTIINQIDISAETLLNRLYETDSMKTSNSLSGNSSRRSSNSSSSNDTERDEINRIRDEFIKEIKQLEFLALTNCEKNLKANFNYYNIVGNNNPTVNIREKEMSLSQIVEIKNRLINQFCIIIEKNSLSNKFSYKLGLLIILDWYLNENDFKTLNKALFKAQIIKNSGNPSFDYQLYENSRDEPSSSILNNSLILCEFIKERIKENDMAKNIIKIKIEEMKNLKKLDLTGYQIARIEANTLSQLKNLKQLLVKIDNLNELIGNFSFVNLNNINLEELYLRYYSDNDTVDLNLISGLKNLKFLKIINEYQGSSNKPSSLSIESIYASDRLWSKSYSPNLTKLENLFLNDKLVESLKVNYQLINNLKCLKKLNLINTDRFYSFIDNNNNITSSVNNQHFLNGLTSLEEIVVQYTKIKNLKQSNFLQTFRRLKKCSLCLNEIEEMLPMAFQNLSYLEELDLNFNIIKTLENDVFAGMKRLKVLKLFNNKISRIKQNAMYDLSQLIKLDLGINELDFGGTLNFGIFDKLVNLKILCLSQNSIGNLEEGLFENLLHLEELDLSFNSIRLIKQKQFASLGKLKYLNLNNNKLERLEMNCFDGVINLEELNLNNNELQSLSGGYFKILSRLKVLDLSENLVRVLDETMLTGLNSMAKLDLSSNMLEEIHNNVFLDLESLAIVNLSMNRIEHVEESSFSNLVSLSKLIMHGNPAHFEHSKLINLEELDDDENEDYIEFEYNNSEED